MMCKNEATENPYIPGLDPGIERAVVLLRQHGVETYESCEGGEGHSYPEPAVRFYGENVAGFRALGITLEHRLPVSELRRVWRVNDDEPTGPTWELVFYKKLVPLEKVTLRIRDGTEGVNTTIVGN